MQDYLMTSESLNEQEETIKASICPLSMDPARCDAMVESYWKDLAGAMYPKFLEASDVCRKIGACPAYDLVAVYPTCAECQDYFTKVAAVICSDNQVQQIVDYLKSDFCPTSADLEECAMSVDELMPSAMAVLSHVLVSKSAEYCCMLSSQGICC